MRISAYRRREHVYIAVAQSILIVIYYILKEGAVFKDLGAEYYNPFNKERKSTAYLKNLKTLG